MLWLIKNPNVKIGSDVLLKMPLKLNFVTFIVSNWGYNQISDVPN